jgi:hypothetical protein
MLRLIPLWAYSRNSSHKWRSSKHNAWDLTNRFRHRIGILRVTDSCEEVLSGRNDKASVIQASDCVVELVAKDATEETSSRSPD